MEREEEERGKKPHHKKTITSADFTLHWPSARIISIWHFRTGSGMRVHLKHGWNIFGRRSSSHVEIKEPRMKSTEFCVRVLGNEYLLVLYDISGNLLLNGKRTYGETVMLHNGARVGVIVHNVKVIYFEFHNKV